MTDHPELVEGRMYVCTAPSSIYTDCWCSKPCTVYIVNASARGSGRPFSFCKEHDPRLSSNEWVWEAPNLQRRAPASPFLHLT